MNPMVIAQLIIQFLPYGVKFAEQMVKLIYTKSPSLEDWLAVLAIAQTPMREGLNPGALIPDAPTDTRIIPASPAGTTTAIVATTPIVTP